MAVDFTPLAAEIIESLDGESRYTGVTAHDLQNQSSGFDPDQILFVHGIDGLDELAEIPEMVVMFDRRDLGERWLPPQLREITGRRIDKLSALGRFATEQTDTPIELFTTVRKSHPWPQVPENTAYFFREFVIVGGQATIPMIRRARIDVIPHMEKADDCTTQHQATAYLGGDPGQHVRSNLYPK